MEKEITILKYKQKKLGLLANILIPLIIVGTMGVFYIGLAFLVVFVLPLFLIAGLVQYFIWKKRIKKFIREITN
jgi:ABC-type bacteriocin/lantibiotic exporter with double-glycine peptidase domain